MPFMDTVVSNFAFSLPAKPQGARASRRSGCCGRPSSRSCRTRSCTAASAASRSRLPPGCAASSSRSPARRSRPRRSAGRASSARRRSAAARRARRGREDLSRQLWGLLAFTLWYERHVERHPPRERRSRASSRDEGLGRLHRERAPARLPAARRAAAGAGARGRDHRARLRADAAADRVARDDGDGDRPSRRPLVGSARRGSCARGSRRCAAGRGRATSTSRSRTGRTS